MDAGSGGAPALLGTDTLRTMFWVKIKLRSQDGHKHSWLRPYLRINAFENLRDNSALSFWKLLLSHRLLFFSLVNAFVLQCFYANIATIGWDHERRSNEILF